MPVLASFEAPMPAPVTVVYRTRYMRPSAVANPSRLILDVLIAVLFGPLAATSLVGEEIDINGEPHKLIANCPNDQYDLSIIFGAGSDGARPQKLGIAFGLQDTENAYYLTGGKGRLELAVISDGERTVLARQRGWRPGDESRVLIRRREHFLYVRVNEFELPAVMDDSFGKGQVGLSLAGGVPLKMRYQPVAEIIFDDNFMREEASQALAPWEKISGQWRFHSVKEKHSGTLSTHSVNPFSLGAQLDPKEKTPALAIAGHAFWSDYEYQVSVKSHGGEAGVVFGYLSKSDHLRLTWELTGYPRVPRRLRLVKVAGDGESLLAEGHADGGNEQWYRIAVRLRGRRVQIFLDESLLFDVMTPDTVRGRVGLVNSGPGEVVFDDVRVRDNTILDLDHTEAFERLSRTLSGRWQFPRSVRRDVVGSTQHCGLAAGARGRCAMSFGPTGRTGGVLSFEILPRRPQRLDLLVGEQKLAELSFGGEGPDSLPTGTWHLVRFNLTEPQHALVYVDDVLHWRQPLDQPIAGPPGIALQGAVLRKAAIRRVRLARDAAEDFELPTRNQLFVVDPFMKHWSSPEGAWIPVGEDATTFWHKGDFFGRASLTLPPKNGVRLLFASDHPISGTPDSRRGYEAMQSLDAASKRMTLTLLRAGRTVASGSVPIPDLENPPSLRLHHDGKYTWASIGDRDVLNYRDSDPLPGTAMAIAAPEALVAEDFKALDLRRDHVRDETFEHAFADWIRTGTWEVTNRFSCTPTWSHLNGRSLSGAFLWSKFEYEGDLSLEYYVGNRMRQSTQMMAGILGSYPRVGDFNASFNCTGLDPTSGYTYLLGAWDPHWSEKWSRLLRAGKEVARTDKYLTPRTREGQIRAPITWVAAGRPVHGAWYFIKIRRRSGHFEYYFDNKLVPELCFDDPDPLDGNRLAIWTQNNSMVIARAKISYTRRRVPSRLRSVARPAGPPAETEPLLKVTSATNPGLYCDFEESLCGWKTTNEDQGADLDLDSSTAASGRQSLRLTNASLGGDFGAVVPITQLDATRVVDLSFDYRLAPEVKVNVYLTLGGRQYFIRFSGDERSDENLKCLGQFENVVADGEWHPASFGLDATVLEQLRPSGSVPLTSLVIGSRHEGYLQAGLGGNPEGAAFHLDNFRVVSAAGATTKPQVSWALRSGLQVKSFSYSVNGSPDTVPDAKADTAEKTVSLGDLQPGLHYLHLRGLREDGTWTGSTHFPLFLQPPLSAELRTPPRLDAWDGGPVVLQLRPEEGAHLAPWSLGLTLNGRQLSAADFEARYECASRTLTLDFAALPMAFDDGQHVQLSASFHSAAGGDPSKTDFALTMSHGADLTPPSGVTLTTYPPIQDFEGGTATPWAATSYSRVSLDRTTAATGRQSLKIFKPLVTGNFSAGAISSPFFTLPLDLGKTPVLAFDYRLEPKLKIDFTAVTAGLGWYRHVTFAGSGSGYPVIGSVPDVHRDGTWRHAEVDLRSLLIGQPYHPSMFLLSSLVFADYGGVDMGKAYAYHIDNFGFLPAASSAKGISLAWKATDPSGIRDYSYHWSAAASEEADNRPEGAAAEAKFSSLPEGAQYFHIRARDRAGNWSRTAHYKFFIDNQPPVVALKSSGPEGKLLELSVQDERSGVDVSTLKLTANGKSLSCDQNFTTFDQSRGKLLWDWQAATGLCSGKVANGAAYNFQFPAIADHAGNSAPPLSWTWKVDHAKDKEPPPAPAVAGPATSILAFESFTNGVGSWRNWAGQSGSMVTRVYDPERKDYCLKVVDDLSSGSGGVMINPKPFDAAVYPWISFDYKIPPAAKIHFMVYTNALWRGITLTVPSTYPHYTNIGSANIKADNTWRSASFNLLDLLRKALPQAKNYVVQHLAIADYYTYYTPAGVPYYIDNFAVVGACPAQTALTLSSFDSSGIARFRYVIDEKPDSPTDKGTVAESPKITLPALKPGNHYLHASAADGAGNWSRPTHLLLWFPPP